MTWPRWHWLNDGLIPLLVFVLRVCWLWPWLEMLRHWLTPSYPHALLSPWALLGLFVLSMAITRLALQKSPTLTQARAWVSGAGLAAVLTLLWWQVGRATYPLWNPRWLQLLAHALSNWTYELPPSFLTLIAAATVWVRGVLDGRRPMRRDAVWGSFTTGVILLALLLLAGHFDPSGLPAHTERWVLTFFMVGLSALALSSLELARVVGRFGAPRRSQIGLNRYWLVSVAIVILGMVGLGLILGAIFTPAAVAQALSWVGIPLSWIGTAVGYLFLAVSYVLFLALTPLIEWIRSQITMEPPAAREPLGTMDWQERLNELSRQSQTPIPPEVIESLRWLWLSVLIIGIVIAIVIALRLMRFADSESEDESRESIFTNAMLKEQLAALWRNWRQRLQQPTPPEQAPYLSLNGEDQNRRTIRGLYQELLRLAGAVGLDRTPPQTPLDYQAMLQSGYPDGKDAWQTFTEQYMVARYAPQPPTAQQVQRAQEAWQQLAPRLTPEMDDQGRSARPPQAEVNLSHEKDQTNSPRASGRRREDAD